MKKFMSVNVLRFLALTLAVVLFMSSSAVATNPQVAAGQAITVGLKSDGTVLSIIGRLATGNPSAWTDITQVSVSSGSFIVGLKSDGTCVSSGMNNAGQCSVSGWTNIVQVVASHERTIGLRSDGTVVMTYNNGYTQPYGQEAVRTWTGIKQISAGIYHIVGLKYDGTVVGAGSNCNGQINVGSWSNIVQISAAGDHTVGLKADGTVVALGSNDSGESNVSNWTGITQVSAGYNHTVGLKSDGTAVAVGQQVYDANWSGGCNVQTWTNLVQVSAGLGYTVGLKSDGTVVATGNNYWSQYTGIEFWNLGSAVVAPVMVAVPNVITFADTVAETTITKASLQVGAWDSNYSTAPINTVISQSPAAGTKVSKGSAVKLTLSLGAAPTYEATATLKIMNKVTKVGIAGVTVTTRDKNGYLLQVLTTNSTGVVTLKMPKAGKVWIYSSKAGFTPVLYPDVQVINKGSKNSIVSYMNPVTVAAPVAKTAAKTAKK